MKRIVLCLMLLFPMSLSAKPKIEFIAMDLQGKRVLPGMMDQPILKFKVLNHSATDYYVNSFIFTSIGNPKSPVDLKEWQNAKIWAYTENWDFDTDKDRDNKRIGIGEFRGGATCEFYLGRSLMLEGNTTYYFYVTYDMGSSVNEGSEGHTIDLCLKNSTDVDIDWWKGGGEEGETIGNFYDSNNPTKYPNGIDSLYNGELSYDIVSTGFPSDIGISMFCYPNPFNPGKEQTTVKFNMQHYDGDLNVRIFTLTCRLVKDFTINVIQGVNEFSWDGRNEDGKIVADGGYICEVRNTDWGKTVGRVKIAVIK